jgi:RNA polymerase sigma factor (sigma-70 family)
LKAQYLRYQTKRGRERVQDEMIRKRALLAERIVAIGWSDDQWTKWAAEARAQAESVLRCKKNLEEALAVLSKREKRLRIAREELEHKMSCVSPEAVDTIARALARTRRARFVLEAGGDRYVVEALCRFPFIMETALRIVTWCHRGLKPDIYFSTTDGELGKKLDWIVTCWSETSRPTIPPGDHDEKHRGQDNETRHETVRRNISELPWPRDMISIWISEVVQRSGQLGSLGEETATIRTLERKVQALYIAYPDLFPERGNRIGGQAFAVRMGAAIQNVEGELASIKDALVTTHRGLVWTMARRYRTLGVEISDLAQEGMQGLLRALERFDSRRGYRFSTYATYWIRKFILRFGATQGRIIQLPVNQAEHVGTLMKAIQELSFELEREPSPEEVARRMQVPEREVRERMAMFRPTVSLDARSSENDARELQEKLAGRTRNPEEDLVQRSGEEMVGRLLEQLDPIKKEILLLRYFGDDPKRLSLAEMARRVRVSKEKVLALEKEALDELARRPEARQAGYLLGVLPAPRNGHQNVDGAISKNGKDYGHERK